MKKPRPHAVDIEVGALLRMRRHMLGVSQEALGGQMGISFQQIQKYESGANRLSASRLHAVSILLDVSIEFFFQNGKEALTQEAGFTAEASRMLASKENMALNKAFLKIGDLGVRLSIVELIEALGGPAVIIPPEYENA
jgi:transcriptional regulator with XRE-family HTH domain